MYQLQDVYKTYGHSEILHRINCDVRTDGFVFIMGPSGSGKSTLLRLLSFVEVPDKGRVHLTLGDVDFDSSGSRRPWPIVTCVFQRQFLWPHLTLRQNLVLPLKSLRIPQIEGRVQTVVDLFEMSSFIDRFPNEVSGGQAQRAALARAFVLDPKIILIDEAHGGLDLEQQEILNEHLLQLRQRGVGLIVVTHSLDFARPYADQVIVIEDGSVTEVGDAGVFDRPQSGFLKRAMAYHAGHSTL